MENEQGGGEAVPDMKWCGGCQRELPRTAFSRDRSKRDGLRSRCKTCDAETPRAWYAANADAVRERHARWYARMVKKRASDLT